jgi:protein-tyrosine-phosphatase
MAMPGSPASSHSRSVAQENGMDLAHHQSQAVREELVEWADDILCMGDTHRRALLQKYPFAARKTHLLREAGGLAEPWDISDPVGQSLAVYQECATEIEEALEGWLQKYPAP